MKQGYGKETWRPVQEYVEHLLEESLFPPEGPLIFPWENTGPGYCYGPAFGHWDSIHIALDLASLGWGKKKLEWARVQAKNQIKNLLYVQQENGMFPSMVWMKKDAPGDWAPDQTHPPVWVMAADLIYRKEKEAGPEEGQEENRRFLAACEKALRRQIGWFETARSAADGGFYYTDIKNHLWESGVDEGVRFYQVPEGEKSCVDATAHMYLLYDCLAAWQKELYGSSDPEMEKKRDALGVYIRDALYDKETGFFYDSWSVKNQDYRHLCFEGFWPVIVGAASGEQAERVIREHLMNNEEFFTSHPMATVAVKEPLFEKRMWRGPAWNSMTMWAVLGCLRYGKNMEAARILEACLDRTAAVYKETGCIWEFYDSLGERPETVQRKPHTEFNVPCRDYLGHNPLHFMGSLWDRWGDGPEA